MELPGKFYYVVNRVNGFFQTSTTFSIQKVMVNQSFIAMAISGF